MVVYNGAEYSISNAINDVDAVVSYLSEGKAWQPRTPGPHRPIGYTAVTKSPQATLESHLVKNKNAKRTEKYMNSGKN